MRLLFLNFSNNLIIFSSLEIYFLFFKYRILVLFGAECSQGSIHLKREILVSFKTRETKVPLETVRFFLETFFVKIVANNKNSNHSKVPSLTINRPGASSLQTVLDISR